MKTPLIKIDECLINHCHVYECPIYIGLYQLTCTRVTMCEAPYCAIHRVSDGRGPE